MANRVLRVERGGALLGSFALDAEPIEVVLVDGDGVLCRWVLPPAAARRPEPPPRRAAPDGRAGLRVDEPRPVGLDRGDGDELTLPLPEPPVGEAVPPLLGVTAPPSGVDVGGSREAEGGVESVGVRVGVLAPDTLLPWVFDMV